MTGRVPTCDLHPEGSDFCTTCRHGLRSGRVSSPETLYARQLTAEQCGDAIGALDRLLDAAMQSADTVERRRCLYDDFCAVSRSLPGPSMLPVHGQAAPTVTPGIIAESTPARTATAPSADSGPVKAKP